MIRPATRLARDSTRRAMPPVAPQVRVSIGELHLPGLSLGDGERFASAFSLELARRLGDATMPLGFARESFLLDRFRRVPGERPDETGRRLGLAVADVLTARRDGFLSHD